MVKFASFYRHILPYKSKKMLQHSSETMDKTLEGHFQSEAKSSEGDFLDERCSKSEGNDSNCSIQQESGVIIPRQIRKSISLGSGLDRELRASSGSGSENEKRENDEETIFLIGDQFPNKFQENPPSDLGNNESVFSIGDTPQLSKYGHDISDLHLSTEGASDSCDRSPTSPPEIPTLMLKSKSLQNVCSLPEIPTPQNSVVHARSAEDLTVLDLKTDEKENIHKGACDINDDMGSTKDWIVNVTDEVKADEYFHGEYPSYSLQDLPGKDFKIKRIEEWVLDLQHCGPLEETSDEVYNVDDDQIQRGATILDNLSYARFDDRLNPGMEVAKKYVSSLSPTATAAHLANHGLVVVPLLSAFVSIRTLNLSGNFIVRITAGSLPRALHVLNLSKNSISTIEGLRELTRLRVLDLSYNRIVRIGHGLASCSSLKELYLARNKISEVEGLHRLLKLNVLDLRFNKISTAKSLGQLAANYSSLQAISLEGNPAQKNVGDEQLKKYLQGLLPQLAYYNRHSIKSKSLSDASDRSARLGITSKRGLRSDHKTLRKGNRGVSSSHNNKSYSSSIHGHRTQVALSSKSSKNRPVCLPPIGSKTVTTTHRSHFYDVGSKILGIGSSLSMRRVRSEGTIGPL